MIVAIGGALAGLLLLNTLVIAPYNLSYFNPLLGGSRAARETLLVGWGKVSSRPATIIEKTKAVAPTTRVVVNYPIKAAFVCERPVQMWEQYYKPTPGDYVVIYVNFEQRAVEEVPANGPTCLDAGRRSAHPRHPLRGGAQGQARPLSGSGTFCG